MTLTTMVQVTHVQAMEKEKGCAVEISARWREWKRLHPENKGGVLQLIELSTLRGHILYRVLRQIPALRFCSHCQRYQRGCLRNVVTGRCAPASAPPRLRFGIFMLSAET